MSAPIHQWVTEPVPPDVAASLARLSRLDDAVHIAVMPDVHLCHEVCIGTVFASASHLHPWAIGSDIGCGVATVRLSGATDADLARGSTADDVLEALARAVPIHRHRTRRPYPPTLDPDRLSTSALRRHARREAAVQLGTIGRGNHFLELQADDEGALWLMVHTGSRSLGRAIQESIDWAPRRAGTAQGDAYLADVVWAGAWAAASRQAALLAGAAALHQVLGVRPDPESVVVCDHNHVRRECHHGQELWVHRKGAISAREGERGLIPGSMGSPTFHVRGRGHRDALCSSSHGAGRTLSRTEARQTLTHRAIRRQLRGITHRATSRLAEQAPGAYRDIEAVMRAQRDLTRIVGRVHPRVSLKG